MLAQMDIGLKALGAIPRKTEKKNVGSRDVPITFAGVTFKPNGFVYADGDGIVVANKELIL